MADPLWAFYLHGWEWAWPALTDSGNAARLLSLWHDWIADVPIGRDLAWEPYPVSRRLGVWAVAWHLFGGDREQLRAIAQHAAYLAAHMERDLDNNHLIANAKALAWVGLLFPFLPEAGRWRALGLNTLRQTLSAQVRPDGGHVENSTSYHVAVWLDALETALIARAAGAELGSDVWGCLSRMESFARALERPDGRLPLLNDSIEDEPLPLQQVLRLAAATGNRSEGGSAGGPPGHAKPASRVLRDSGYAVLRAGTGGREVYLVFDFGDLGPAHCPGHGHADALSFELWANGEPLVVDPGTYQYPSGQWRDYFRSTAAHSTATVDGLNQSTFAGSFRVADMAHGRLLSARLSSNEQEVVAEHDGYARLALSVVHRRSVRLEVSGDVVLEDSFLGSGCHDVELRLHLAPCQLTLQGSTTALAVYRGGSRLVAGFDGPKEVQARVEDGWLSRVWYCKERVPVLAFRFSSVLPITVTTHLRME